MTDNAPEAVPFAKMVERINKNRDEFNGAFVLVLPGEHDPVVSLIVGPDPDAAIILSNVMNQLNMLLDDLKHTDNQNRNYRR